LPPFLLVHGTADMSVPYNQSVQLQAKLKAAGVSCDLITIDDGVHGMARWQETDPTYKDRVVNWIAAKLGTNADRRTETAEAPKFKAERVRTYQPHVVKKG
jgi:alpha-L-fucosidase 2